MNISVIGTGYVGLVSGACLADRGHSVTCVDVVREKVERINAGGCPIHEAGLPEIIANTAGKSLFGTLDLVRAVHESDLTLVAAPTPFDGSRIDLSFIRQIAAQIGSALKTKRGYHVVVVKSTVVPGTTDDVVLPILEQESGKRAGEHFGVGMNPEFLSEGSAVFDFMNPDRIVVGGIDARTQDAQAKLYASFTNVPLIRVNNRTAEMIKYASNALQATMISFANEIANLSSALGGIDAIDVMMGVHAMRELNFAVAAAGASPRSPTREKAPIANFIFPGCGFGGSCFPKDVKAIVAHGQSVGQPMPLLDSVLKINADQPGRMITLLQKHLGDDLRGKRVTVLGLAFKPNTDDVRESPAIAIIKQLVELGADVTSYDPVATEEAKRVLANVKVRYAADLQSSLESAEGVLLVTKWDEFKRLPELLAKLNPAPVLIDGRRFIDKNSVARYDGIGR